MRSACWCSRSTNFVCVIFGKGETRITPSASLQWAIHLLLACKLNGLAFFYPRPFRYRSSLLVSIQFLEITLSFKIMRRESYFVEVSSCDVGIFALSVQTLEHQWLEGYSGVASGCSEITRYWIIFHENK